MRRITVRARGGSIAILVTFVSATSFRAPPAPTVMVTREIIAEYLGTEGTDARSGMTTAVRDMRTSLSRQAVESGRRFISRGVSLELTLEGGLRHLALLGDKIGTWVRLGALLPR